MKWVIVGTFPNGSRDTVPITCASRDEANKLADLLMRLVAPDCRLTVEEAEDKD